jgi:hypothetical protein
VQADLDLQWPHMRKNAYTLQTLYNAV